MWLAPLAALALAAVVGGEDFLAAGLLLPPQHSLPAWSRELGVTRFTNAPGSEGESLACPCSGACAAVCVVRALHRRRPAQWYAFLQGDVMVLPDNLHHHLRSFNHSTPWLLSEFDTTGSRSQVEPSDHDFVPAHCGLVMSAAAVQLLPDTPTPAAAGSSAAGSPGFYAALCRDTGVRPVTVDWISCRTNIQPGPPAPCPPPATRLSAACAPRPMRRAQRAGRPAIVAGVSPPPQATAAALLRHATALALHCPPDGPAPPACRFCLPSEGLPGPAESVGNASTLCHGLSPVKFRFVGNVATERSDAAVRAAAGSRLIDLFSFSQEVDVLEVKLFELYDHVDLFVMAEQNLTHRGDPRQLVFPKWQHHPRFARYADKLRYVATGVTRNCTADPWGCENEQRLVALRHAGVRRHDVVLVRDVDEIVSARTARQLRRCSHPFPHSIVLKLHRFSLRWLAKRAWPIPAFTGYTLTIPHGRPMRGFRSRFKAGGWHLTSFGGARAFHRKLASFAHTEVAVPNLTQVRQSIQAEGRTPGTKLVDRLRDLPRLFQDYPCYFPHFVDPLLDSFVGDYNRTFV